MEKFMKNIIDIIKHITNNISNNRGAASGNVVKGLSVGVFAVIILYGVYSAYNNSPAYNPARRNAFFGEGQNLSANALEGFSLNSDTGSISLQNGSASYGSGVIPTANGFESSKAVKRKFSKEQADFEAARAYMEEQKTAAQSRAGQADNSALNSKKDVRRSFNGIGGVGDAAGAQEGGKYAKAAKATAQRDSAQAGETQLNRLASSGGSSGAFSGGSGGGSRGGSSSGSSGNLYASAKDSGSKTLPQNNIPGKDQTKASAFQHGRGGAMGGFNVAAGGGGSEGGGKRGGGGNAGAQLKMADRYSRNASKSLESAGGKNLETAAQSAENAFDGGGIISGSSINGDNVVDPGPVGLDFDPGGGVRDGLKDVEEDTTDLAKEKKRLQQYVILHMIFAAIAALSAAIAIAAIRKTANNIASWAGIAVIASMAMYSVWGMDYDGDGMLIPETLERLDTLRHASHQDSVQGWYYIIMGTLSFAVLAAIAWGDKIANWAEENLGSMWQYTSQSASANQIQSSLSNIANTAIDGVTRDDLPSQNNSNK